MNPDEQSLLRICLLRALRPKGDLGMAEKLLHDIARRDGFAALSMPEMQSELREMENKNWVAKFAEDLAPARWFITALGEKKLIVSGN
jgi:hypothetical protein